MWRMWVERNMEGSEESIIKVNKAQDEVESDEVIPNPIPCPRCQGMARFNVFLNKFICDDCGFKVKGFKVKLD
jgi:hypothetical protein